MSKNPYQQQQERNLTYSRADLDSESFDILIRQKGYWAIWEQGLFCPCINQESGQPNYNCPMCKGRGYIYINPKKTKVLVTSISGRKEQDRIGLNDQGTCYATPLSTDDLGFRDRLTFLDFKVKYSELVTRSEGTTDTANLSIVDILMVRDLDRIYRRGIDFEVEEDKPNIVWKTNAIQPGTQYTIAYMAHPSYIAINPIHELRGTYNMKNGGGQEYFVQLPSQYQIKREDFLRDGDV